VKPNLQQIDVELLKGVDRKSRYYLADQIPKGEALLAQINSKHPLYGDIIGPLTKMYLFLNKQLGTVCRLIGYQPKQETWPDSQPLEILAKIYPGLATTQWYQRQLSAMLMPSNHPWLKILTSETPETSPSQKAIGSKKAAQYFK